MLHAVGTVRPGVPIYTQQWLADHLSGPTSEEAELTFDALELLLWFKRLDRWGEFDHRQCLVPHSLKVRAEPGCGRAVADHDPSTILVSVSAR